MQLNWEIRTKGERLRTKRVHRKSIVAMTRDRRELAKSEVVKQLDRADNAARQRPDDRQLSEICEILRSEGVTLDAGRSMERPDAMTALVRVYLDTYKLDC
jgi:hypothetical protein